MRIRNRYRYFLTAPIFGTREIVPLGENELNETFGRFEEDFVNDYVRNLEGKLKLVGGDFEFLNQIETSVYRCDTVSITVQRLCGGIWTDWFTGRINLAKCDWNPWMCEVDVTIERLDNYTCFHSKRDGDVDLFELVPNRHVLKFLYPDSVLEIVNYQTDDFPEPFEFWNGVGTPESGGWVLFRHEFLSGNRNAGIPRNICGWIRERRTVDCAVTLPSPWILVSENCPGSGRVYARPPILYGLQRIEVFEGDLLVEWSRIFKVMGRTNDGVIEIDNGMKLADVLAAYFTNSCSLSVVSDFFQINAENPSAINYVTGVSSKVRNLLVFQKSDVKRAGDINNATVCKVNFERFFFGLCRLFNLEYRITGGTIRIEHVSFWSRNEGIDLTNPALNRWTRYKTRYQYDTTKLPKEERFLIQEKTLNSDFEGVPITYSNGCANSGSDGKKEYTVEDITTDLQLVLNNPEPDSKAVTDAGVFLAATDPFAGDNILITESGIISDSAPNNSLAWSQLLRDYHRHKRPFRNGRMNNQDTTFDSVIAVKKGEEIGIPLCCGDDFNPSDTMASELGVGEVESATFNLGSGILSVNLLYAANDEASGNASPFANPDTANIQVGITTDVDVLANDSDANGIGTIDLVEITTPPVNGTAIVVNKKIRYTPNPGFTGSDSLLYRIRDNALQYSNIAVVSINVTDPAPVAINDTFTVRRNQTNNVAAPGLLANDTPGAGNVVQVIPATVTSNLGRSVAINADGSFTYPAPDLDGSDSFSYTIINNLGLQDTATATLNIITVPTSNIYSLAMSQIDAADACSQYVDPALRANYYSTAANLIVGVVLFTDDLLTEFAEPGFYSNGINAFEVGANGTIIDISIC